MLITEWVIVLRTLLLQEPVAYSRWGQTRHTRSATTGVRLTATSKSGTGPEPEPVVIKQITRNPQQKEGCCSRSLENVESTVVHCNYLVHTTMLVWGNAVLPRSTPPGMAWTGPIV